MPTKVRSHAKINLGLGIGAPRADGFHALCTVYQTLELHDLVTVEARPAAKTSIRLTSNDGRVPTDERNTAWKMLLLALGELGVNADVLIHIEKRLPIQGGLGAGSANAVAALAGLEAELRGSREQKPCLGSRSAGDCGKGRLRCSVVSDRRDCSRGGSGPGGISPSGHRAGVVRSGGAGSRGFNPASLSRLG
jgi:hypothetical protein